jgi:DNA invertase Pin-like site-specific DNA recombinase
MNDKVDDRHRQRAAYVYIRQSKMHQVREHRESRRRQYELESHAQDLGFREVTVIDEDVGRSGTGNQERPGFARLLSAVCEGSVGAVLALEASRLARNNRDWHHLIDLCALADTLVIDGDGIYDPRLLNDRLILGMKGSMAEFELGLMRQRAQEALREMIARGEVLWEVPVGYVRTEDNRIEMTPDLQVQEAIRGVFAKFRELGSARQVHLWYCQEQVPLPSARHRNRRQEVAWRLPVYKRVHAILTNPCYSGAFFHGRTETKTVVTEGRARKSSGHRLAIDEWGVLIRDHHAGYISWNQFTQNQSQLQKNLAGHHLHGTGAAKKGRALLSGLLRCARCGRKLNVAYVGKRQRVVRYVCRSGNLNHGTAKCLSFGGLRADRAVADCVLAAVQPLGIEAALEACKQAAEQDREKQRALQLALEKARYEADRARRQYDTVEPENRLVAAELESRWDQALQTVTQLEHRLQESDDGQQVVGGELRARLLALGDDLSAAWHHPNASPVLKKRILRCVLEEIVVDVVDDPPRIKLRVHWQGGVHTELMVAKNRTGQHRHSTNREVLDVVRELAKIGKDRATASILNRLGYCTGTGKTWTESRVASLRSRYQIPLLCKDGPREWLTLRDAAETLELHHTSVMRLIRHGILPASQPVPYAPWVIERNSLELPGVCDAVATLRKNRRARLPSPDQRELPFS